MTSSRPWLVLVAVGLMLGIGPAAWAQSASKPALTAAFLYNFARFVEWSAEAGAPDPLTICVLGDAAIADALDETIKGRTIDGRQVAVSRVQPGGFRACHVLYLAGLDAKGAQQIVDGLRGASVLTVGDGIQFAQHGGIAGIFVEQGRMRFAFNVDAAQRMRLRVSSRLLSLAQIVKDDRAYR